MLLYSTSSSWELLQSLDNGPTCLRLGCEQHESSTKKKEKKEKMNRAEYCQVESRA